MNMYYTSQNHPSVLLFSLGEQGGRGYNMYEAYRRLKAVEKKRPVIYEGAGAEWNSDLVVGKPGGRNASDDRYTVFSLRPSLSTKNSRRWARPRSRPERLRAKWRSATAVRSPT